MSDREGVEPAEVDSVLMEAAGLADEERWEEAREMLLLRLPDRSDDADLLCWLGIVSRALGEDGDAYEFFRRALIQEPEDPFVLASIGTGIAEFDDPEAERVLRLAALTAPETAFVRAAYGAYLAREGHIEQAVEELAAARSIAPDDPGPRTELGIALLLAGRIDEGITELEQALSFGDEDPWLRSLYGLALREAGRNEEGAEELHRASMELADDVEVQLVTSLAASSEGWKDEAWNALARAEAVATEVDMALIHEVEEALELGEEASARMLHRELGPSLLRARLQQAR